MLLTTGFKEVTTILANTYYAFQSQTFELAMATKVLKKRLDQMKIYV